MLDQFISDHRSEIIAITRVRVESRSSPTPTEDELVHGIPAFLEQLCAALRRAEANDTVDHTDITESAEKHGGDLFRLGLTIGQVVHDYGSICQSITGLAFEKNSRIDASEFQTLNLCLDDAISSAVTAYALHWENRRALRDTERLGAFAHELRNLLNTALLSFESIWHGRVPANGSTGLVHQRSLLGLRNLIDRSLADVRLDAGIEHREQMRVADVVHEVEAAAAIQAQVRQQRLLVSAVDRSINIDGDRQIIVAALSNLLQNAFKFSQRSATISLTTRTSDDRVFFDVEDECGGLPEGTIDTLFLPFAQRGKDRRGVGLGLSICAKAARAHGGEIRVRDVPTRGCVFTLELPIARS